MKRKTATELCQLYNTAREQYKGQKLRREKVDNIFKGAISVPFINLFIKEGFLEKHGESRKCFYMFKYDPVHISRFERALEKFYSSSNSTELTEEKCLRFLLGTGKYKIERRHEVWKEVTINNL